MSDVRRETFKHEFNEYFCDEFQFLHHCVPTTSQSDQPVRITCFHVSNDILVFGCNNGMIYGFRRRTKITKDAHFKLQFCSNHVTHIHIVTRDLVLAVTSADVCLFSLSGGRVLWKTDVQNRVTALNCSQSPDGSSILIVIGDCCGHVTKYELVLESGVINCINSDVLHHVPNNVSDKETTAKDHNHEVVQIDVINSDAYLISTCFRSVILSMSDGNETLTQIGKNERKICGKYGAVYCSDKKVIHASRPSAHLIRASIESGHVIQTFMLKRAARPPARTIFSKVRSGHINSTKPVPGLTSSLQLGKLSHLSQDLLLSWTSKSLTLVSTSGSLLIDECNLIPIVDVCCLRQENNEFEAFILFTNRILIRVRNMDLPAISSSSSSEEDSGLLSLNLTQLLPQSFSFPAALSNFLPASFELKIPAEKTPDDVNSVNTSNRNPVPAPLFTIDSYSQEEGEENRPPLVTHRRVRKKSLDQNSNNGSRKCRRESLSKKPRCRSNPSISSLNVSRISIFSNNDDNRSSGISSTQSDEKEEDVTPEDEKLLQILNAYRQTAGMPVIRDETSEASDVPAEKTDSSQPDESQDRSENTIGYDVPAADSNTLDVTRNEIQINSSDGNVASGLNFQTCDDPKENTEKMDCSSVEIPWQQMRDLNYNDSESETRKSNPVIPLKWERKLPSKNDLHFDTASVVAISAFNDDTTDGLAMLSSSREGQLDTYVNIFPGWKKIKCPDRSIGSGFPTIKSLDVNCKQILLLFSDGCLYRSTNWSPASLSRRQRLFNILSFLNPLRFEKLDVSRTRSLISISVNSMDNVCWSCDEDGVGWVIKLGPQSSLQSCILARDDSCLQIRLRNIVVSPRNSAIVWAVDDNQRLYCRAGIFNERSDKDTLIAGINWVPVDDLPGQLLKITASSDSVWIICRKQGIERLFRRVGINTPFDYIGSNWLEYELPLETMSCSTVEEAGGCQTVRVKDITASPTDDLWILTENQEIYQFCPHADVAMKAVENGWLLI